MNDKVKELIINAIKDHETEDFGFYGGKYVLPETEKEFEKALSDLELKRDDLIFSIQSIKGAMGLWEEKQ